MVEFCLLNVKILEGDFCSSFSYFVFICSCGSELEHGSLKQFLIIHILGDSKERKGG